MSEATRKTASPDPEMVQFMADIEQSLGEAMRGEGRITTPDQVKARRAGRPVGSVKASPKVQTAIRFDADVLAALKATGKGWQTRVNDAMREWVKTHGSTT